MKLCRFELHSEPKNPRSGLYYEGKFYETDGQQALGVFESDQARLLPPLERAPSIRAISLANAGGGSELIGYEFLNPARLVGPNTEIKLPLDQEDFEIEVRIACFISALGAYVGVDEAEGFILGYAPMIVINTPALQASLQHNGLPTGSASDAFVAVGPVITTPDELEDIVMTDPSTFKFNCRLRVGTGEPKEADVVLGSWSTYLATAARFGPLVPGEIIAGPAIEKLKSDTTAGLMSGDRIEFEVQRLGRLVMLVTEA